MADNITYLSLKKRLTLIKLFAEADNSLSKEDKIELIKKANELLMLLDVRYDDGKYLDPVEEQIEVLEHRK